MTTNGYCFKPFAKTSNKRFSKRNRILNRWKREQFLMAGLTNPNFSNPNSILIRWILCNNITKTTWHTRYAFNQD